MVMALLLALFTAPSGAPAAPPQSATIRGRVTDRDTGQPLARFRVSLSHQMLSDETVGTIASASTDADGRYELAVAPGTYLVTARPPEYVASHLPQVFGVDEPPILIAARTAKPIALKADDVLAADFALRRSLAIEGFVSTTDGDPVAEAIVSVERLDTRVHGTARTTDERGHYRQFGLPPGSYRVCASQPANGGRASSDPVIERACVPITLSSLDVAANIVVRRTRGVTVSGTLLDSAGAPLAGGEATFVERDGRPQRALNVLRPSAGTFAVEDVNAGTYTLRVAVRANHPPTTLARESGELEVVVSDRDVDHLVLRTRRDPVMFGVVTFEGPPPAIEGSPMLVRLERDAATETIVSEFPPPATVREDFTFDLKPPAEPVTIALDNAPAGWIVKSISYRRSDVTGQPVTLEPLDDPRAIEITLSNQVVFIDGRVTGARSAGQALMALAIESGRERTVAASALVADDGTFKLGPLRPGEYFAAAVDRDEWFEASIRDRSSAIGSALGRAERVQILEGGRAAIVVAIGRVREP